MIPYAEALRRALAAAGERGVLPAEEVALEDALGRVCAQDLRCEAPIPPFDNSAMDGYAVPAERTLGARPAAPARLDVVGLVTAGDAPPCAPRPGAWEITTGAPLPAGCDAVVPVEVVSKADAGKAVLLASAAEAGDYVRKAGSDFAAGDLACAAGETIDERRLLALAAIGAARPRVRRKPRVAILSTGRELVAPDARPGPGQIRDATGVFLAASLRALGADVVDRALVADDPEAFTRRLHETLARKPDLVVSTGAVSMGRHDFIAHALAGVGARELFHKTAIRPGKPILAAVLPTGALFFGLPGNPVSTAVGLRFFVAPVLRRLLGRPDERPLRARVESRAEKPAALRAFLKARLRRDGAALTASAVEGQGSHQIKPLLDADAWLVAPEGLAALEAGAEADVYPAFQ